MCRPMNTAVAEQAAEAHYARGNALAERRQWEAALADYDRAIAFKPDYARAFSNRGNVLAELKQWEAALASFGRAIAIKPDYAEALSNRGNLLADLNQWQAALADYDRAIAIKPYFAVALSNRGNALTKLKRWEAALASYERAIALQPDYAEARCNRGCILTELKQFDAALENFDQAIRLRPDFAEAHFYRSVVWLLRGEYAKGWEEYEWRRKSERLTPLQFQSRFRQPLWLGEQPIAGKTILLYGEQGLGDTLQFCRYASLVAKLGASVILEVQEPLLRALASVEGVSQLLPRGSPLPNFDYYCPLVSLPLAFKTDDHSIPRTHRYLASDPARVARWDVRLGQRGKPRIGLTWSGSATYTYHDRSVPLATLVRYLPDDYQYVSLQKDVREADRATLQSDPRILDLTSDITDFADTAALCDCLDLVISVDTSVAHLSGALGQKTWILLSFVPDWRWLLDRSDSAWYPSATLYRQEAAGDWSAALKRVRRDLAGALMGR
jgi:tetratricopeptide (TPR) repeat protein